MVGTGISTDIKIYFKNYTDNYNTYRKRERENYFYLDALKNTFYNRIISLKIQMIYIGSIQIGKWIYIQYFGSGTCDL